MEMVITQESGDDTRFDYGRWKQGDIFPSESTVDGFDVTVAREGLDSVKHKLWNPLANLISGGRLHGDNLRFKGTSDGEYDGTDFRAWNFESVRPSKNTTIQ